MEDDVQREGSPGGGEPQSLPNSDASTAQDVKRTSIDADELVSILLEKPDTLDKLYRGLQSTKDRGFAKLEKEQKSLAEQIAEVKKIMDQKDWPEDAAVYYLEHESKKGKAETQPAGNRVEEPSKFDPSDFLGRYGFTQNDPEVVRFIVDRNPKNPLDWADFVIERKSIPGATPKPSQVMPSGGGSPVTEPNIDELTARLVELQKDPTKHIKERQDIMKKLKELTPRK